MSASQTWNNKLLLISTAYQVQKESQGWVGPLRPSSPQFKESSCFISSHPLQVLEAPLDHIQACHHFTVYTADAWAKTTVISYLNYCKSLQTAYFARLSHLHSVRLTTATVIHWKYVWLLLCSAQNLLIALHVSQNKNYRPHNGPRDTLWPALDFLSHTHPLLHSVMLLLTLLLEDSGLASA